MEAWEKIERLRELVGDKAVLDELVHWLDSDTLNEFADDYIHMYDLEDEFPELQENRYEPSLGPNTNQWWVYDHETNEWVDPPTEVLRQLGHRTDTAEEVDRQSDMLQQIVNENPDWLYDKDHRYNGDLEI